MVCASSSGSGSPDVLPVRFFLVAPVGVAGAVPPSSALRLFVPGLGTALTDGLPARLPAGLVARLPALAKGLVARLPEAVFGLPIFGLVARLARIECPRLGAAGEAARDV